MTKVRIPDLLASLGDEEYEELCKEYYEARGRIGPWVEQICDECARLLGGRATGISTMNATNPCDVCGRVGVPVTEPRDWSIDLPIAEAQRRRSAIFDKADECEGA